MYPVLHTVSLTTDASGDCTAYSTPVTGRVLQMRLVVPGSGGLAATTDLTITGEDTGVAILTQANQNGSTTWAPRQATHATADGSASLYAAAGEPVEDYVVLHKERIKVVVAQGGNATTGTLYVWAG